MSDKCDKREKFMESFRDYMQKATDKAREDFLKGKVVPKEEPQVLLDTKSLFEDGSVKTLAAHSIDGLVGELLVRLSETGKEEVRSIIKDVFRERFDADKQPGATEEVPAGDSVHHPSHYGGDTTYETIKVIEAWYLGFHLGNAVKYISRAGKKGNAIEDLEKAIWYIRRFIEINKKG